MSFHPRVVSPSFFFWSLHFHVVGALLSERFPAFATAMHAVGTAALGAGIFLSGQIFNLEEHWSGGVMLWAVGAWIAWWLSRDCCAAHSGLVGLGMD
jgi:uncharacterized membrane protein